MDIAGMLSRITAVVLLFTATTNFAAEAALDWSGDFLLRLERFDQEKTIGIDPEPHFRQRFRARLGVMISLADNMKVGIRLASGTSSATSTYQTHDDAFSTKGIGLDLAYLQYQPLLGLDFTGGKMKNPFITVGGSDLILDTDVTPEGFYAGYLGLFGPVTVSPRLGSFVIDERDRGNDAELNVAQLGIGYQTPILTLVLGGGIYNFANFKGQQVIGGGSGNSTVTVVNSNNETQGSYYVYKYKLTNLFAEVTINVLAVPIRFYIDSVTNPDPPKNNQALLYGVLLGSSKKAGEIAIGIADRNVEKDAVVGALTDADMAAGGSGVRGRKYSIAYGINDNAEAAITHFDAKRVLVLEDGSKTARGFDTTQLDVTMRF